MDNLSSKNSFLFNKYYFDCIDKDGKGIILYQATLGWKSLTINYSSLLAFDNKGITSTKTSWNSKSIISLNDNIF